MTESMHLKFKKLCTLYQMSFWFWF